MSRASRRARGGTSPSPSPRERGPSSTARSPQAVSKTPTLSLRKKIVFAALPLLVLIGLLELTLSLGGVETAARRRDAYAGFTPQSRHFVRTHQADGTTMVTVSETKTEVLNPLQFPASKPEGTYRIACLGGSSTYGRPFYDDTSYPGHLRALLPVADPSRSWEVINGGAISYASYRVRGLLEELTRYEVDLFVIDVGHNEFLERRTYDAVLKTPGLLRRAAGVVSQTRTATLLARGLETVGLLPATPSSKATGIGDEVVRIPLNAVGPEAYHRDDAFAREVLRHLEASLNAMIDTAESAGARVVLIAPASNLRDFAPIKSEHGVGLSPDRLAAWQAAYDQGREMARQGKWAEALTSYEAALAIDSRFADLHFRHGQALWALERQDEARKAFLHAKEEDICPLRSLQATTDVIRKVARERQVPLLDFEATLAARSPHGVPGEEAFADHVHMQITANEQLALDLIETLTSAGIVQPSADWSPEAIAQVREQLLASIDRPKLAGELCTLSKLLDYLGQPEQALHRVQEAQALLGRDDAQALTLASQYLEKLGQPKAAEESLRKAVATDPEYLPAREALGGLVLDQGQPARALELLEPVLKAMPHSVSALNRVGVAQAQLGRHREAIATFQRAIELAPSDPVVHANLGLAHERSGSPREALQQYRESLRLDPSFGPAREGLARLGGRP